MWDANGNLNTYKTSGLPNITGGFSGLIKLLTGKGRQSGAFYLDSGYNVQTDNEGDDDVNMSRMTFSASKSNSIYGDLTIVQPPAVCVNVFILVK